MKRQADSQVWEEDEKERLTDRFGRRMKRQADGKVREEDEKSS
jgi:hypothetical protein